MPLEQMIHLIEQKKGTELLVISFQFCIVSLFSFLLKKVSAFS